MPKQAPIMVISEQQALQRACEHWLAERELSLSQQSSPSVAWDTLTASPSGRPSLLLVEAGLVLAPTLQLMKRCKAHDLLSQIPIIVLVSTTRQRELTQLYQHGAAGVIELPLSYDRFSGMMRSLTQYWLDTVALPVESQRHAR